MATITASSELVCYGLTYWDFHLFVEKNGVVGWKLLQRMATLLRATREPPNRAPGKVSFAFLSFAYICPSTNSAVTWETPVPPNFRAEITAYARTQLRTDSSLPDLSHRQANKV
jgi:hypothetical protein